MRPESSQRVSKKAGAVQAKSFDRTQKRFEAKHSKTMECLAKGQEKLLVFCNYPVTPPHSTS